MPTQTTTIRNEKADQVDDSVNAGANPGALRLWTGAAATGTLLATFTFGATAFGAAGATVDGRIDLSGVPITATAVAAGTAVSFDIVRDAAGTPVQLFTGTAGDVGTEEVVLDNAVIANGQDLDLTALTILEPAS